ncbi:hypothetical protein K466DRAFT_652206 [Polyporus arcularius HHB13444]|uniref:Uncharacterized protein n=1 Tax=Polyporus arcularius HHB13444 TaxID=1314778 RepID=A0A5C3PJ04_9APHY|nr:hypothetical protein K466DRAFT_652206 [Polyporus arcularius HHB13444]
MTRISSTGELQLTGISSITAYPGYEHQNTLAPHTGSNVSSRPSSTKSSRTRAITKSTRKLLSAVDQGCFLTGISDVNLHQAHLINAACTEKAKADGRAKEVIYHIVDWLGIAKRAFFLEHLSNIVFLLPGIHVHIDSYSTIAITCAEHDLLQLIDRFKAANKQWQDEIWGMSREGFSREHIDQERREPIIVQDPDISYDVVVLKPAHFAPFRCPLVFRDAPPAPVPQGQPITPVESYSMWSVQDGELRAFGDDVIRPPFKHATARRPPFLVNSLFWVLNAAWKFREFKRRYPDWAQHVTIRGQRLMQLTQDLAAQIYWRPTYVPDGEVLDPIKINEYKTAEQAPEEKLAQKPDSGSKTETETARRRRDASPADQPEGPAADRADSDASSDDMGSKTSLSFTEDTDPCAHEALSVEETRQIIAKLTNLSERYSDDDVMDMSSLLLFGHSNFELPPAPGLDT